MNKKRGIAAERELLHILWNKGFACCRVAGSGSIPEPSCDLLAGNTKKRHAIEVKTTKKEKKYINKEQFESFLEFSDKFGLAPLFAIKFMRQGWFFIKPEHLDKTEKNYVISLEKAKLKNIKLFD
jgi:Holliday junction resolvase